MCFAMRASIFGPISSPSWKAKTKSGLPSRARVLCDPVWRFTCQPIVRSAARTRLAFEEGQLLMLSAVVRNRTYSAVRARLRFAGSAWLAPVLC